jgi:hypothetical protein
MINIKDIRVVQKLRRGTRLVPSDDITDSGRVSVEQYVEKTSWTLQIKRYDFAAEWEDVQVIEEYEDD